MAVRRWLSIEEAATDCADIGNLHVNFFFRRAKILGKDGIWRDVPLNTREFFVLEIVARSGEEGVGIVAIVHQLCDVISKKNQSIVRTLVKGIRTKLDKTEVGASKYIATSSKKGNGQFRYYLRDPLVDDLLAA